MSSILLTLASEQAKLEDPANTDSDFTVTFPQPINLGSLNYEVALLSAELWYSVRNITGSKSIRWSSNDGVDWIDLAIPDGVYTVEDINDLLLQSQVAEGVTGITPNIYGIQLQVNYNTNRCRFVIDNTVDAGTYIFKVDLTASGNLAAILGFTPAVISVTTTGANVPDIAGADQWQVRCDLIRNSYDGGSSSDVLYGFTPQAPPNSNLRIEPLHLTHLQVNKSSIYSIRVRWTNNNGDLLDFAGENSLVNLVIRPIK